MLFKIGDAQSGNTAADLQVNGDDEVTGEETAGQFCGSPGTYPIHFVAKFSRPFASYGTWQTEPTGCWRRAAPRPRAASPVPRSPRPPGSAQAHGSRSAPPRNRTSP
jgi:hypothetical protein